MPATNEHNQLFPKPWVYHSLFWVAYYIFAVLICLFIHHIGDPRFYAQLASLLPLDMVLVYWYLYLLRHYLRTRRSLVGYVLLLLLGVGVVALANITVHRTYTHQGYAFFTGHDTYNGQAIASQMLNSIYLLGLATAAKFGKDWMLQKQQLQEIEKTQVATELAFLRAQIQPHFFFNTLNNLYSLTLQKSDKAPEVVLKLSELMSYMLYESTAPLVPLEKEIVTLENYLSLEQLRFGNRLSLSFEHEGPRTNIQLPPLLLLAFVENSFKHGMSHVTGQGRIHILLQTQPGDLLFHIENPIAENSQRDKKREPETQGIGLKNVIRRLDLLYRANYSLDLKETATTFYVTLKIPLP